MVVWGHSRGRHTQFAGEMSRVSGEYRSRKERTDPDSVAVRRESDALEPPAVETLGASAFILKDSALGPPVGS